MSAARVNPRAVAGAVLTEVIHHGRSLGAALDATPGSDADDGRALVRELAFGVLRWLPRLEAVLAALLRRPLAARDADVHALLLVGLYQLEHTRVPPHAAVAETVAAVRGLGKEWATGLANAVLRRYQRERETLLREACRREEARFAHPAWLIEALRAAWPGCWQEILAAGNERAPMTLRVNARRGSRDEYRRVLAAAGLDARDTRHAPCGLVLDAPVAVDALPGFREGAVSVQDEAAQLAAGLLGAKAGMRVLDACAAPGGKAAHVLESLTDATELVAVDASPARVATLEETLSRLRLPATVVCADATRPDEWWDGIAFDRVLLDAPCTATGIIRRHPDIKVLRKPADVDALADTQRRLLHAAWRLVARGGLLLYATCSILPAENDSVVEDLLAARAGADACPIEADWGRATAVGRQILPGEDGMDGFYYALLRRG